MDNDKVISITPALAERVEIDRRRSSGRRESDSKLAERALRLRAAILVIRTFAVDKSDLTDSTKLGLIESLIMIIQEEGLL